MGTEWKGGGVKVGGERDQARCARRGVQSEVSKVTTRRVGGGRALPRCPALVNLLICIGIGRPHLDDDMISAIVDRELEVGVLLFSRLDDPHDAHLVQVAPIDRETLLAVRMLVCILQLLDRDWDERRLVPASTGLQDEWRAGERGPQEGLGTVGCARTCWTSRGGDIHVCHAPFRRDHCCRLGSLRPGCFGTWYRQGPAASQTNEP